MTGVNLSNTWPAISAIVAVCTLLILVGTLIASRLKAVKAQGETVKAQNEQQLAKQRRIERDLFGEDPDNPDGHKGPSLRELVTDVALNTRGHSERLTSVESRLGKLEDRFDLIEDVVLRRPGGS